MFAKNGLRVKARESRNYFDSGPSLSWSGVEGATEVAEREETADAVGVVGDGAVADSTVVVGGTSAEHGSWVECPNTFDRRLANFPITDTTLCCSQSPIASHFRTFAAFNVEHGQAPTER